jgi:hypothetical protein
MVPRAAMRSPRRSGGSARARGPDDGEDAGESEGGDEEEDSEAASDPEDWRDEEAQGTVWVVIKTKHYGIVRDSRAMIFQKGDDVLEVCGALDSRQAALQRREAVIAGMEDGGYGDAIDEDGEEVDVFVMSTNYFRK